MTYGNEPRRKRSTGSSRRDETDEADNWLAGLRGGRGDEPDPFSGPADPFDEPSRGPASTLRSTEPPTRPFQSSTGRGAPPTHDDSSPIAESNGASRVRGSFTGSPYSGAPGGSAYSGALASSAFSGVPAGAGQFPAQASPLDDESPSRGTGRRRARDDDESPSRSRRAREAMSPGGYEEPPPLRPRDYEEAFGAPPGYPPPGPPSATGYAAPPPPAAGYAPPPPAAGYAAPPVGRRAARDDDQAAYVRRIGEEHSVYDVPAFPARAGGDESGTYGRRGRPDDESPSAGRRARPDDDRGAAPQPRAADYDVPSGRVGRRRARDDEAPEAFNGFTAGEPEAAGRFNGFAAGGPDPAAAAAPRTFAASSSYDHGPTLEPIIKPMTGPVPPPDEPPPLVPIFPGLAEPATLRDEPMPAREDARWARPGRGEEPRSGDIRGAEPRSGDLRGVEPRSGDLRGVEPRSGDLRGVEPRSGAAARDFESRSGDVRDFGPRTGDPRTADRRYGYDDEVIGYADKVGYESRGGFTADPATTQAWRPAAASASPAAPTRAGPYPPVQANGARRPDGFYGPGGDYSGEFTSGGTRRPPRQSGGPATLDRPAGRARRSTAPTIDPVQAGPEQHRPHKWIAVISVIGVLALVAVCGLGTWFMINDERKGPAGAQAGTSQSPTTRDISSRTADPAPLTQAEVFPNANIVAAPNEAPYTVLTTAIAPDCSIGATDDLAKLLATAGCSQVVRGTLKSPTGDYLVTAGLFNLNDQKAASDAFNGVKPIVDGQKGRFVGMSAGTGTGTDAITRAPTQLSWNYRGHFIAYAVIARTDGQAFAQNDPYPNQITFDIVETYLENGIIGARATVPSKPSAAASILPAPGKS